jgi:hypothetical protein
MLTRNILFLSVVATGLILSGCTPESFESASDLDAVVTMKTPDADYDYSAKRTWTMPPEVLDLSDGSSSSVEVPHKFDALILEEISNQMEALGYEFVPWPEPVDTDSETDSDTDSETDTDSDTAIDGPNGSLADLLEDVDADLIVIPGIVATQSWVYYDYYSYSYYGYYWYAYYPPSYVAVSYEAGTLIISMMDKSETIEDEDDGTVAYQPVWTAALRGLLAYIDGGKVQNGIQQAFKQSPYLDVTGDEGGQP